MNRNMFWNVIDSVNSGGPYPDQETHRCRLTATLFPRICARSRTLPGRELVRQIKLNELFQSRDQVHAFVDQAGRRTSWLLPGLAIVLNEVGGTPDEAEEYAVLTVSFGDFLSLKNGAYIDTNNCYFADQLLRQGIAEDTGFSRHSGFCQYPLWRFKEEFLKEIGGENYQEYLRRYDEYMGIGRADRGQDQGMSMQ